MFNVQRTSNAHGVIEHIPERCWRTVSRHRIRSRAEAALAKLQAADPAKRQSSALCAWSYNVRIVDDAGIPIF